MSPSFTVGAMCFIERADGALLLVRHSYRERWGVPGGLLQRGEDADDGARREVLEEVGLVVELVGEPAVVVDARPAAGRRRLPGPPGATGADPERCTLGSAEIVEARWFPARRACPSCSSRPQARCVALARVATGGGQRPLPEPVWPSF